MFHQHTFKMIAVAMTLIAMALQMGCHSSEPSSPPVDETEQAQVTSESPATEEAITPEEAAATPDPESATNNTENDQSALVTMTYNGEPVSSSTLTATNGSAFSLTIETGDDVKNVCVYFIETTTSSDEMTDAEVTCLSPTDNAVTYSQTTSQSGGLIIEAFNSTTLDASSYLSNAELSLTVQ